MSTDERTALVARWEAEYRALGKLARGSIDRTAATLDLVSMATDLQAAYADVGDRYRTAMWERRAWLIQHGQGGIYDGTDALVWQRHRAAGITGASAETMATLRARRVSMPRNLVAGAAVGDFSTHGPHEGQTTMPTTVKAGVYDAR